MANVIDINAGKDFTPATDDQYIWITVELENREKKFVSIGCKDGVCDIGLVIKAFESMAEELNK